MNIFDPLITGSLSVSGSGEISGDLTVLGTINATISGTTSNAITASEAPKYTLTSSFDNFTGSYTTGSFTGSFIGDGGDLYNIPASGVTGLNLTQIADGNVTASISNVDGLRVNTNTEITGALIVTGSITLNGLPVGTGKLDETTFYSYTSSVNTYTGNTQTTINTLATTASVNSLSTSVAITTSDLDNRLDNVETSTGSLNSFTSSINTTIKDKLNSEGVISGSIQVNITGTTGYSTFSSSISTSIGNLSSSVATTTNNLFQTMSSLSSSFSNTDSNHTQRLNTIESHYATTGSNNFIGNQTITGSLYISQNLIVQGSSSLENITASAVSIGTNTIILNTDTPAFRYAGISVFDSGSTNVTASLFYDSLTNQWKFKHTDTGTNDASIMLFGPLGNNIDNAPLLDGNYITKVEDNGHGHHLTTSSILDNGSKVSINSNSEITGSLTVTGVIRSTTTPLVSGSSQVSFNGITDKPTLVSGSSQVSFNGITDKPTLVSGSSQITYGSLTGIPSGIVSGSVQVKSLLPSGTVSGSSQVLNGTTIHSGAFFNGISVVSGSAQISFNGITDKPTLVSGSSQVSYTGLSNIPTGIVSGSSQITLSSTSGYGSVLNQAVLTTSSPTFGGVTISGGNIIFNPGTGALGNRYLTLNKGTSNDGGILMSRDNTNDWQIVNATSNGNLWVYSYGVGHTILEMERSTGNMVYRGNILPQSNGVYNLGSSSLRWNTVFTSDLSLSNGIGDYTIVEGENDLFLYNNKQNKVYKFMLQEVNPNDATPKRPE